MSEKDTNKVIEEDNDRKLEEVKRQIDVNKTDFMKNDLKGIMWME